MEWYYSEGEQRRGPISQEELRALMARGLLTADDFVWRAGMADWVRAGDAPELAGFFRAPTYPPPDRSEPPDPYSHGSAASHTRAEPPGHGGAPPSPDPPAGADSHRAPPKTNGLAVAALIMGILSLCCGCLLGVPAIICGHIAHSQVKASNGRQTGAGMAIAGFILGYLGFLTGIVLGIFPLLMNQQGF